MKQAVWDELSKPYAQPLRDSPERLRWRALGVELPAMHDLDGLVRQDLDSERFGVRWWHGHISPARNILLADYLIASIQSTSINLCEAKLHHHELVDWIDREPQWKAAVDLRTGSVKTGPPRPTSVAADLSVAMVDLHIAGFFRAICSALDCFAACAAIVLGLPREPYDIHFADLRKERNTLARRVEIGGDARLQWLEQIAGFEERAVDGPWTEWLSKVRHQYVHKARRMLYCQPMPRHSMFVTPLDGMAVCRIAHFLPSQPHLTEVQDRREAQFVPVLTEEAQQTTQRAIVDVVTFLRSATALLLEAWSDRRSGAVNVTQPGEQWKNINTPVRIRFPGFAPGSRSYEPDAFLAYGDTLERLKPSAILDGDRHLWAEWMAEQRRENEERPR